MTDKNRSKEHLLRELKQLRNRVAELETESHAPIKELISEATWKRLVDVAPIGVFVTQDSNFVYTNPMMTELIGYSSKELMSMKPWDLVHPDMRELTKQKALARARGEAVEQRYVVHCQRKDGNSVWIDYFAEIIDFKGKSVILGTAVDITARTLAENKLAESEGKYRTLVEGSEVAIFIVDHEGTFTFMNEAAGAHLGGKPQDFIGKTQWDIFPKPVADRQMVSIRRVIETGGEFSIEAPTIVGGKERVFHTTGHPLRNAAGQVIAASCTSHDHSKLYEAKNTLSKSEETYRRLVEHIPVGVFQASTKGKVISANPALVRMYGCESVEEYLALPDRDSFRDPSKRDKIVRILREKGRISNHEVQMRRKDGSYFWISLSVHAVLDEKGAVSHYDGTEVDITERKLATDALKQSAMTMSALLNAPTHTLFLMDTQGILLTLNEAFARELDRPVEELVGTCVHDYIPALLLESREARELEVIKSGKPVEYVDEHEGSWRANRLYPVFDNRGTVEAIAVYSMDITDRRKAENALRESESRYREILDGIQEGIGILDEDEIIRFANSAFARILGESLPEKIIGKSILDFVTEDGAKTVREQTAIRKKGQSSLYELEIRVGDTIKWLLVSASPRLTDTGEFAGFFGAVLDITDRKMIEQALQESNTRYRTLVEASASGIGLLDKEGDFLFVNDNAARIWGEHPKDMISKNISDVVPPDFAAEALGIIRKISKTGIGFERERYVKSLDRHFLENVQPVFDEKMEFLGVQVLTVDITERKQAEEALRESEERFKKLSNLTFEGILIHDKGLVIDVNESLTRMLGYTREEIIGENIIELCVLPEYHGTIRENIARKHAKPYEIMARKKDGRLFPIEIEARDIERGDEGLRVAAVRDITERKQAEGKIRDSQANLLSILENTDDLIMLSDENTRIVYMNSAFARTVKELVNIEVKPGIILREKIPDGERQVWDELYDRALSGERFVHESSRVSGSGETRHFETWFNPIRSDDEARGFSQFTHEVTERKKSEAAIREGENKFRRITERSFDIIFIADMEGKLTYISPAVETVLGYRPEEMMGRNVREFVREVSLKDIDRGLAEIFRGRAVTGQQFEMIRSDGETVYVEANSTPIIRDGLVVGNQAIVRDISLRRRAEEMLKQAHDEQSRQLRQAAGGLAHDVYNDLFPVAAAIHKF